MSHTTIYGTKAGGPTKTNDSILRKFTDKRTDRQTDEGDFIGHCLTNVKRTNVFLLTFPLGNSFSNFD